MESRLRIRVTLLFCETAAGCHKSKGRNTIPIVVAKDHTMQARVEGAIGYVKQHSRVAMLTANVPTQFWPQATTDFVHKKNYLWYFEDTSGKYSTAYERMQPAFAGTRDTVAIPFGSRVVSTLPREHSRILSQFTRAWKSTCTPSTSGVNTCIFASSLRASGTSRIGCVEI